MNPNVFYMRCEECGRDVAIHSVSEFHNVGGFRGYSFNIVCECGARSHHDGNDGELIPDSLKHEAAVRHRAFSVHCTINDERRAMRSSPTKTMLKDARVEMPEPITENEWLVYRLPDGRSVSYLTETGEYKLNYDRDVQLFSCITTLTATLADG